MRSLENQSGVNTMQGETIIMPEPRSGGKEDAEILDDSNNSNNVVGKTCSNYQIAPVESNCDSKFSCSLSSSKSRKENCVPVPVPRNEVVLSAHQQKKKHASGNFIVQYFKRKSQNWSRDQFLTILILSFVEFFASAVVSIQAPFYPDLARKKGAHAAEYGLVFGIFEITVFLISPVYGSKMSSLGPTRVFNCGILVTGVCCIIFGLLDQIEGRATFIWTCIIVRIVEAMGDAAFETASFTIIAAGFPSSVGQNFAILEICYGLGMIIGPTLGGGLYQLGGYKLPFLAMGGFLFASAIATYFLLPEPGSMQKTKSEDKSGVQELSTSTAATSGSTTEAPVVLGGFHMFKMLRIPVIAMTAYSIVAATAGVGFLSANLELHLEQLNKLEVGMVFVLNGGVYAVTAPAWGWICDHTSHQKVITLIGAIFTIFGFIFIGPVPYFPYETTLPMSCVGLALFGFGLAATLVSAFLQLLNDAINHNYPDDVSTYGLVSGLWTSMAALGYFIGPSLGGVLDDYVGFRWCSVFVIGAQIVLILMLCVYFTFYKMRTKRSFHLSSDHIDKVRDNAEADIRNHNDNNTTSQNDTFKITEFKSNLMISYP